METVEESVEDLSKEVETALGQRVFQLNGKLDKLEEVVSQIEA